MKTGGVDTPGEDSFDELLAELANAPAVGPFKSARFVLGRSLGQGGFGAVYEAEDRILGRTVALKMLLPRAAGFAENIERLKSEFRSLADVVHPNLVGLRELVCEAGRWFITMDLVEGVDFLRWVRPDGSLSELRLREALEQLGAGVVAIHDSGKLHRDLKPSNVLVDKGGRVVILDFGLVSDVAIVGDSARARAGTPAYMAPEQLRCAAASKASDWYSVGVMLHQALGGGLPSCPPDRAQLADAPGDLVDLCLELLALDPAARPTGSSVSRRLQAHATTLPPDTSPQTQPILFVGRDRELAALREALAVPSPIAMLVRGAPGIGKTALLSRFVAEVRSAGTAAVLEGRCYERESVPYKAFDGIVDALCTHLRRITHDEAVAVMPRDIALLKRLFPVLDSVPATSALPTPEDSVADDLQLRHRAFDALKALFAKLGPLVVVIDDLQWTDIDSARLLLRVLGPPDVPRMMLVCGHRPDETSSGALAEMLRAIEASGCERRELAIEPLPSADAERLTAQLLGDRANVAEIVNEARGQPLHLYELARHARDGTPGERREAPSLGALLRGRIARLEADARALLETVAIAGQPLPQRACLAAAGLDAAALGAVRALRAANLVMTHGAGVDDSVEMFHDRIREIVTELVPLGAARERHLALAITLEKEPRVDPEALAKHFDAAGETERAGRYATVAGDAARTALAFDRASSLYRMALERTTPEAATAQTLRMKLAQSLVDAGFLVAGGRAYLAAANFLTAEEALGVRIRGVEHLMCGGEVEEGRALLEAVLRELGLPLIRSRAAAIATLVKTRIWIRVRGLGFRERAERDLDPRERIELDALESAARALEYTDLLCSMAFMNAYASRALTVGEPGRIARGLAHLAAATVRGSVSSALEISRRAEEIARRHADPRCLVDCLRMRGTIGMAIGDWSMGRANSEASAALIQERCIGMSRDLRYARKTATWCALQLGDLPDVRARRDQLRDGPMAGVDGYAEYGYLADDDVDAAFTELERTPASREMPVITLFHAMSFAHAHLYTGLPEPAAAHYREVWPRLKREGWLEPPAFDAMTAQAYATSLVATGDLRGALRVVGRIQSTRLPVTEAVKACVAAARRDDDAALRHLAVAETRYDAAGMRLFAAACRFRRGERTGDAALVEDARATMQAVGIKRPERWAAMYMPGF